MSPPKGPTEIDRLMQDLGVLVQRENESAVQSSRVKEIPPWRAGIFKA
jgi:hypothetical protein